MGVFFEGEQQVEGIEELKLSEGEGNLGCGEGAGTGDRAGLGGKGRMERNVDTRPGDQRRECGMLGAEQSHLQLLLHRILYIVKVECGLAGLGHGGDRQRSLEGTVREALELHDQIGVKRLLALGLVGRQVRHQVVH